jgi:hypothetical protein
MNPEQVGADWDRARRVSEQVSLHILAHTTGADMVPDWNGPQPWIAVRLSDGTSDGNLYPSKAAAVSHQLHENQCAYFTIPPGGMTPLQAHVCMRFTQQMYENGIRIADPDMQVHVPPRPETHSDVIRQLKAGN